MQEKLAQQGIEWESGKRRRARRARLAEKMANLCRREDFLCQGFPIAPPLVAGTLGKLNEGQTRTLGNYCSNHISVVVTRRRGYYREFVGRSFLVGKSFLHDLTRPRP